MRRLTVLVLLALVGCSPAQERAWLRWFHREPQAAAEWAVNECGALCSDDWDRDGVVEPDPVDEPDHPGEADDEHRTSSLDGRCSQWASTALAAGWSSSDWPTVDRIMYAESRCNPDAYNGASGVAGLMQIHPLWKADSECAGNLYDPYTNLVCARHVWAVQGWQAWVTY
jgi:lysozyme-like protein